MFSKTVLFTALASMALVQAAPVVQERDDAPSGWAYGYLESYGTYHTRYLALDCQDNHGKAFFDSCCHPLLAGQSLDSRPSECTPSAAAVSSVSAELASPTGSVSDDNAASQFQAATSTVTSTKAAKATQASNNDNSGSSNSNSGGGGGGNVETGGFATFFYQGGNPGACGNYHSDSDKIIAIDQDWYGNSGQTSPYCGQWIQITNTNNGKTVTAQVQDDCPTCANGNSLDLSVGAFTAIADESEGQVPISWSFV